MSNPLNRYASDGRWLTPVEIEVLLHCYYDAEPYNGLRKTPAVSAAVHMWMRIGYIEHDPDRPDLWRTTVKGSAFVHALCSTPLEPRKPLDEEQVSSLICEDSRMEDEYLAAVRLIRRVEAAHGITPLDKPLTDTGKGPFYDIKEQS